jgi:hypothetical protein
MDGDLNMQDVLPSLRDHTGMLTPHALDRHQSPNDALASLSDHVDCFDAQLFHGSTPTGMTPFHSQHLAAQTMSNGHGQDLAVTNQAPSNTSKGGTETGSSNNSNSLDLGLWHNELVEEDGGHSLQRTSSGHNKYMGKCLGDFGLINSDIVSSRP